MRAIAFLSRLKMETRLKMGSSLNVRRIGAISAHEFASRRISGFIDSSIVCLRRSRPRQSQSLVKAPYSDSGRELSC